MNCSDVHELLSAYYDGELNEDQRALVSDHLASCSQCAGELAGFEKLTRAAGALGTPEPPRHIWQQLQRRQDQQQSGGLAVSSAALRRRRSLVTLRRLAWAAGVLMAVGVGWFAYDSWLADPGHGQFAGEFGEYLDEFRRDPDAAQQLLLARYENDLVNPEHAVEHVGYRPAVADGLPRQYQLVSTHVVKMPCCTCVQSVCRRSDGSTLVVFEHDDEAATEWFGDRPEVTVNCGDRRCCLVELDERIAATWRRGTRQVTLVGVRDVAEVSNMVAWLDESQ